MMETFHSHTLFLYTFLMHMELCYRKEEKEDLNKDFVVRGVWLWADE